VAGHHAALLARADALERLAVQGVAAGVEVLEQRLARLGQIVERR
jgi:hypothetical protein